MGVVIGAVGRCRNLVAAEKMARVRRCLESGDFDGGGGMIILCICRLHITNSWGEQDLSPFDVVSFGYPGYLCGTGLVS